MATISFTKEMRLNEKESEYLMDYILKDTECNYEVKTPPLKTASEETLKKVFLESEK